MEWESRPDSEWCREPIPEVHNVTSGKKKGAAFSTIDGKKVGITVGVNNSMEEMSVIFKLIVRPIFQIICRYHTIATSTPVNNEIDRQTVRECECWVTILTLWERESAGRYLDSERWSWAPQLEQDLLWSWHPSSNDPDPLSARIIKWYRLRHTGCPLHPFSFLKYIYFLFWVLVHWF